MNCGLVRRNYGTIRNIQINLEECNRKNNYDQFLLVYANYGIVENFIMNFKVPLYVYTNGGIIYLNYGIVKNGYIYGENIQIINNQSNYKFVGVLVCSNNQNGTIENVFTNVSIDSPFNSINRGN